MYDVIIIGGGPAGVSAGVYASRKKLKTLLLTDTIGGQSSVSASIENWIGDISLKGFEFAQKLEKHLRAQEDIEIQTMVRVETVESIDGGFRVLTKKEEIFETKTLIIATGGKHRHLNVPGEEKFIGKGVVYCSTCDAPFFKNKTVAVVGAGNSGLEACQDLFPYAEKIYLLSNTERLGGDGVLQEEIKAHPKVEIVYNALTKEILGQNVVTGLLYQDILTKKEKTIILDGVFVEIGMVPNTDFLGDLVNRNTFGEIILNHRTGETSAQGIFGAGDATDVLYKQNNISAGQGALSALSAYDFIKKQSS
jgi:NADH-dependent peroxiredoxin subunit F